MSTENRDRMVSSIPNSIHRLLAFHERQFPEYFARELALLLRKSLVLYPQETGKAIGEMLGGGLRNWHGICAECGGNIPRESRWKNSLCPACEDKADKEYDKMMETMDGSDDGR